MSIGTETTDLPFDFDTPGFLTMGHPSHGDITGKGGFEEGSDIDLYKVPVVPGGTYQFSIVTFFSDGSTGNDDPFIEAWYADGPYWTDGGTDDFITLTIPEDYDADHVYCSAEGLLPANTGGYEIKVVRTDVEDDHGASFEDADALELNTTAQGSIESLGDSDAFILDLLAGKRIVVFVTGNPLDPLDVMIQDGNYNTIPIVPYTDESFAFLTGVAGNFLATGMYSDGQAHDITTYAVWTTQTVTDLPLTLGDSSDEHIVGTEGGDEMYLGDGDDEGLGNAGPDWIFGMGGKDRIDGGPGPDHAEGGTENDAYVCNSVNDVCVEYANEGKDTVETTVTRGPLEQYIENMILKGSQDIDATGNALPNVLTGNKGDNFLQSMGGADKNRGGPGDDVLEGGPKNDVQTGGAGFDTFLFGEAGTANADTITDFDAAFDTLAFDSGFFTALGPLGPVAAGKIYMAPGATAAQDKSDRLISNLTTGECLYDRDGTGSKAPTLVATVQFTDGSEHVVNNVEVW